MHLGRTPLTCTFFKYIDEAHSQDVIPSFQNLGQLSDTNNEWPIHESVLNPADSSLRVEPAAAGACLGSLLCAPEQESVLPEMPMARGDVAASRASSRGPLKLSTRRMQQDAVAEKENKGTRSPGVWPVRGFLQTLQSSMPREIARITGVRQPTRTELPGDPVAAGSIPTKCSPCPEAAAVAAGVAAAEAAMAPAPQPLVGDQLKGATQDTFAMKQQTLTGARGPQQPRFSFFHYFVGRPSMVPDTHDSGTQGMTTPPLKPRSEIPAAAGQPSNPVTLSPPYYTPLMMSDPPTSQSQPGAGLTEKHNTVPPANCALISPPTLPTFSSHLQAQPKVSIGPRDVSWQNMSSLERNPSGISAYPTLLKNATAPTIVLSPRHRATAEMFQRSRETLHAAQHATPEQARAILERIACVQRTRQHSRLGCP
jgi:hypothetical protein